MIKRYKRFLADVILNDKTETTMHVANTGAMTGCAIANDQVWYSTSENLKRKYPYSWELTYTQDKYWICVNTIRANQLAEEALIGNKITELTQFTQLQREVKYGQEKSKIDFYLIDEHNVETYIEVKSVTLLQDNQGYFPDAVTLRGQKHLRELIEITKQGKRAVLLFAVLHSGINSVKAATHIDQEYAKLLSLAKESGVEVLAYKANFMNNNGTFNISLTKKIPVIF